MAQRFKARVGGFESRRGCGCLSGVSVELAGRGFCDSPITRPGE